MKLQGVSHVLKYALDMIIYQAFLEYEFLIWFSTTMEINICVLNDFVWQK